MRLACAGRCSLQPAPRPPNWQDGAPAHLLRLDLEYDANDRLIGVEELHADLSEFAMTYTYDNRGRLIGESRSEKDDLNWTSLYELSYGYDPVGNRLTKSTAGGPTVTYTYDVDNPPLCGTRGNRLMKYTIDDPQDVLVETVWYYYDADGNVTRIVRKRDLDGYYLGLCESHAAPDARRNEGRAACGKGHRLVCRGHSGLGAWKVH